MIEVRHRQNILDIHPLVIYLMLSDSEYDRYSKNIKRINKYLGTTLGVFEYKCLRRSNADYSELPERFGNALRYSNVMVKLLGKQNNSNRYALDYIDLNTDGNSVLDAIRNFALNVCGEDIKLLEEYLDNKAARHTDEDRRGIDRIIAILEQALNTKAGRRPKWEDHTAIEVCTARNESTCIPRSHDIFSSNVPSFGFMSRNIGRQMPLEDDDAELCDDLPGADLFGDIRRILKSHNIESDETPEVAKEIYELVKARWDIDKEQSDKNAQAIVEGKPSEPPVISIELIPTTVYGRQREKYGVRITLGDSNIPVIFSHTDQMLLYITSLIRFKADYPLCLRELYRPVVGPLCATERYGLSTCSTPSSIRMVGMQRRGLGRLETLRRREGCCIRQKVISTQRSRRLSPTTPSSSIANLSATKIVATTRHILWTSLAKISAWMRGCRSL